MSDDVLVVVRTFSNRVDADLAHGALEAAGIGSMVRGDDAGGIQPGLWEGCGVAVVVNVENEQAAREILDLEARPAE